MRSKVVALFFGVAWIGLSVSLAYAGEGSIKYIPEDTSIGTWDSEDRIFTLTVNVAEPLVINQSSLTLDGNHHKITGSGAGYGVHLSSETQVSIQNLTIRGFSIGIRLDYSNLNTFENVSIDMINDGFYLNMSSNNLITAGAITNYSRYGFYLRSSHDNTFFENIVSNYPSTFNDAWGIYLVQSKNNTFEGNTISHNSSGIRTRSSTANLMINNTIANNRLHGVYLNSSTNNTIYHNNFIENSTQIFVSGSGNVFNDPLPPFTGNFWSNWTGPDIDNGGLGDGFVDIPYSFNTGTDYLPWVYQDGWLNQRPVAEAGVNQDAHPGGSVTLDGSSSTDPDEDYPLSYAWQITEKPVGSTAVLTNADTVNPSFIPDMMGDYLVELVVTDSRHGISTPDTTSISTSNTPPVADPGEDQALTELGTEVQLENYSYDLDGDIFYSLWTFTQMPTGSQVELFYPDSKTPCFYPDVYGDYVIELTVYDAWEIGAPVSVTVSFNNVMPVADSGGTQAVYQGIDVVLDGSASNDANGDLLTYQWSIVSQPTGSQVLLYDADTVDPWFVADLPGTFVVSLIVNDGLLDSTPSNVTVEVLSTMTSVSETLMIGIDEINQLNEDYFKNKKLAKTLTNKINAVLEKIENGNYDEALNKLENDILKKMDGSAEIGQPDKNDWITTSEGQNEIYPIIVDAIILLQEIMN